MKQDWCLYCGEPVVKADDGAWVRPIGDPANREGSSGCMVAIEKGDPTGEHIAEDAALALLEDVIAG